MERIREEKIPCILCINKIDTVEPAELLPVIAAYNEAWDGFDAIIPISAHSGRRTGGSAGRASEVRRGRPAALPGWGDHATSRSGR